ncbi:hypothetical protein [Oleispirillum naphthae]|uniref:hypothetical protein n=1 Tax=Oleispirillum naphthae TaxID=2838853 RepID=UPI0030824FEB
MVKKWVPTDYIDEVTPPGRATPDDWIVEGAGLGGFDETDPPMPLNEGEIVLFDWVVDLGRATVLIEEDGTYDCTVPIPVPPPGGTFHVFIPFDPDTMALDMDTFVAATFAADGPGGYDVSFYSWSAESLPFEFRDGRFIQVGSGEGE